MIPYDDRELRLVHKGASWYRAKDEELFAQRIRRMLRGPQNKPARRGWEAVKSSILPGWGMVVAGRRNGQRFFFERAMTMSRDGRLR